MTQPLLLVSFDRILSRSQRRQELGSVLFDVVGTSTSAQGLGDLSYGKARLAMLNGAFLLLWFVLLSPPKALMGTVRPTQR